jgi:crossover junction endodeoxyribonuclease RuvC
MKILGIDPGIARTGWGIIEEQKGKFSTEAYGCIETEAGIQTPQRLLILHEAIMTLLENHKPDALVVEELFFNKNTTTAFIVGQARGVILLAGAEYDIPSFTYTPLQVKLAVTGYGKAEKSQVGQMIKMILHLETIPKPDDVADALAVGLTHALSHKVTALK